MNWQLVIVCLAVAAAALYLGRSAWSAWRASRAGCGGGCGCGKTAQPPSTDRQVSLIPPEQLTLRRRPPNRV